MAGGIYWAFPVIPGGEASKPDARIVLWCFGRVGTVSKEVYYFLLGLLGDLLVFLFDFPCFFFPILFAFPLFDCLLSLVESLADASAFWAGFFVFCAMVRVGMRFCGDFDRFRCGLGSFCFDWLALLCEELPVLLVGVFFRS